MGFWNKLGKIALQAAPYVAAPFTGGASLLATGATQKLGQKWAEHDAKKAIEKGIAPSKFDKYLGMASMGAGLASSMGMGGALTGLSAAGKAANAAKAAGTVGKVAGAASKVSGWQDKLGKIGQGASIMMGAAPRGVGTEAVIDGERGNGVSGWQGALASGIGGLLANRGGGDEEIDGSANDPRALGIGPTRSGIPRSEGNSVANALSQGRREAIMNQPFRLGYQTEIGDNDQLVTHDMPPIYPNIERRRPEVISPPASESTPLANAFGDDLTPKRRARKRYPNQEATE